MFPDLWSNVILGVPMKVCELTLPFKVRDLCMYICVCMCALGGSTCVHLHVEARGQC